MADLVIPPKFASEALDKFLIPFVMDALASSLNEEYLAIHVNIFSSGDAS
jgi:hypothetical protein